MKDKKLPIKMFSKRENLDERYVEGMGSSELPKWALDDSEAIKRSESLIHSLRFCKNYFKERDEKNGFIPFTAVASIDENALAKSYRKKITNLFNVGGKYNVVGMLDNNSIIIKIDNEDDLNLIKEQIKKIDRNREAISAVEEINNFEPNIHYDEDEKGNLKVKLISYGDYELDMAINNLFETLCKNNRIEFKKTYYTDKMIIYKLEKYDKTSMQVVRDFNALYSIEDMPKYSICEFNFKESDVELDVKRPDTDKIYPVVGVFDDGIEKNKYLSEWVLQEKNVVYSEEDLSKGHGTFIAGILSYGDDLENKNYTGIDGCKVFDASIFSTSSNMDQDILIEDIENCLKRYSDKVKIWNLSIGTDKEASINKFSDFGIALDRLQDKYDVLICKSAGNSSGFLNGAPKARISESADSVRSIVVGSIAQDKSEYDLVEKNYPSPFTRIGRGPNFIIKPDLVHYGGNVGITSENELSITGIKSFSKDGKIIQDIGTSFSTPRVASILAGIQNELKGDFDSLLIKSIAIHNANYPENLDMPTSEKLNQLGFGVPKNINDALYNNSNEITLVMRDQLSKGEFIEILDFPYPKTMINKNHYYGQIVVTVVYNPILDYNQASEYCQSDLKVYLGTYDRKELQDLTIPRIKNPITKVDGKNLLNTSCYSKKELKNKTTEFSRKEKLLIQYGDKYYPVKKYAVDLDDITPSNKIKYLNEKRNWYLKIEGLYRDAAEKKAEKYGYDLSQEFCVLITMIDNKNKQNKIYDEVTGLLDQNNFSYTNIILESNVEVKEDIKDDALKINELLDKIITGDWDE